MPRALLNLATLRASRAAPLPDPDRPGAVSRRQALGLAGAAALTASPALRLAETPSLGAVSLVRGRQRVAFLLDGVERWVIDAGSFTGTPRLSVEETPDHIQVTLRDAFYPGTRLPADLTCDLRHGIAGWRLNLRLTLGGFHATVPFERWLAGLAPATSTVRLPATRVSLGHRVELGLGGKGTAVYSADWRLRIQGSDTATIRGLGPELAADMATLSLLSPEAPAMLTARAGRRSAITLARGGREWQLAPAFPPAGRWRLVTPANAFSSVRVELGEGRAGPLPPVLAAESAPTDPPISFLPHSGLLDAVGAPFALGLRHALYALVSEPAGMAAALVARYHEQPVTLHALGVTVEVGERDSAPPFEMRRAPGGATIVRVTPGIHRVSLPMAGAVVEPVMSPEGAYVAFVAAGLERTGDGATARVHLGAREASPITRFTLINPQVSLLRPDDLLAVRFEFINMAFETAGDGSVSKLVPRSGQVPRGAKQADPIVARALNTPTYLAVHFPGQNIAEQAIFESVPHYAVQPPDPDAGKNGQFPEGSPSMPVGRELAGESRLVFALPPGTTLPFTLESLLAWDQFTMSVPGTAVPNGAYTNAKIAQPTSTETAIEAPWRLMISPNTYAGWVHSFRPVTFNGRTELWHTRLGVRLPVANHPDQHELYDGHYVYQLQSGGGGTAYTVTRDQIVNGKGVDSGAPYRTIRAVWSPDLADSTRLHDNVPFRMSLSGQDRADLVKLTSTFPPYQLHVQFQKLANKRFNPIITPVVPPVLPTAHQIKRPIPPVKLLLRQYYPLPVQVDRLMLTALGAWMDMRGAWDGSLLKPQVALEEWQHRGTMGRDHYVRVVYKGYLFPFGHNASLVKVTERKFYPLNGRNVAFLFQRLFIIVQQPTRTYGATGITDPSNGQSIDRKMPLKEVTITTKTTPDLDPPQPINGAFEAKYGVQDTDAFWVRSGGLDYPFHLVGKDGDGQLVEFTAPLAFVSIEKSLAYNHQAMQEVEADYDPGKRTRPANGQKMAFAPSTKRGDTTLHAVNIEFNAFIPPKNTDSLGQQPAFYPVVATAAVRIPQVEALQHSGQSPRIKLSDHFLKNDLGGSNNLGEVYAELLDNASVLFGQGNSGGGNTPGVVTPNFNITGLSRKLGPVGGGVDKIASGVLDNSFIQDFFSGQSAKILGAIDLFKIIQAVASAAGDFSSIPQMVSKPVLSAADQASQGSLTQQLQTLQQQLQQQLQPLQQQLSSLSAAEQELQQQVMQQISQLQQQFTSLLAPLEQQLAALLPTSIDVTLTWNPTIGPALGIFTPLPDDGKQKLMVTAELQASISPQLPTGGQLPISAQASYKITGHLDSFQIELLDVIQITFDSLDFTAQSGKKLSVVPKNVQVLFQGPLAFVNDLKDIIPPGGFSVGGLTIKVFLDIEPDHVDAGFSVAVPSVSVGIFSLQNISLGAKVVIPFLGDPIHFTFYFCTKDAPFLLTVSLFGGGGYFSITIGMDGVEECEASFEFGASVSIDLGVASGGISVMAGVYFKLQKGPPDQTNLSGFVDAHGEVSVLDIVSVSLDFHLSLNYEKNGMDTKVWGEATVTLSISILFFSVSFHVSVEKEFAGSHHDPKFKDQVSPENWDRYLNAFA